MSFQPPQQPPSPGWGQPGQGLGFGAPDQQPAAPQGGGRTGRAHKPRQISVPMIVAALVMIAVAVGVVVLVGGGDDSGLDAEGAADGFAALVDDADFDETGYSDLRRCPLGDAQELAEQVADQLDLSDDALEADTVSYVQEESEDYPAATWCYQTESNPLETFDFTGLTLTAGELPRGDWQDFIEDAYAAAGGDATLGDPQGFRGGTIYPFCVEPDDEDFGPGPTCGADWVHEEAGISVGLSYSTDDDDPAAAAEALQQLLPTMVESLAGQA